MNTSIFIQTGKFEGVVENPIIQFPYKLDDFQNHAQKALQENHDVIVCVPTSSGKTTVAEMAILRTIKQKNLSVIYTSPIKALSNDIYNSFKNKFSQYGITVGIITGDIKLNPDAQVLVVTAEILANSLYELKKKPDEDGGKATNLQLGKLGAVVIDEIHYMNDTDRGTVYEETIILLPKSVQLIGLSATISQPEMFANWIYQCRQNNLSLIIGNKRIVPLKHYMYFKNKMYQIMDNNNIYDSIEYNKVKSLYTKEQKSREFDNKTSHNPNIIQEVVGFLKKENLLQAIFFCFSQRKCEEFANSLKLQLNELSETYEAEKQFNQMMSQHIIQYKHIVEVDTVRNLAMRGIGYHHAGHIPRLKEITEILFKQELIKVLFATETLSVGINLPCRTTVFTDIVKQTNMGKRLITTAEYKQMSGRAGRRGLDDFGSAIIIPMYDFPDETDMRSILHGAIPMIRSNFKWNYRFVLKIIQSESCQMDKFFSKSLICRENQIQIKNLIEEKTKLENSLKELKDKIQLLDLDLVTNINKLISMETTNISSNIGFTNINLQMNKKQKKEYENLVLFAKTNITSYNLIKEINRLQKETNSIQKIIDSNNKIVDSHASNIINIMREWDFIDSTDFSQQISFESIKLRGIVAAQINETNPIIMSELICGDYFDKLSAEECIGLVAIFVEPIRTASGKQYGMHEFEGTELIHNQIDKILDKIKYFVEVENKYVGSDSRYADWSICIDYVDLVLAWVNGETIQQMLQMIDVYEEKKGNFVKNMIKISSIIKDIRSVCQMIGKTNIYVKLENAEQLIFHHFVSVDSIYIV